MIDFTMLKEIEIAAKWWAENICLNNQDVGDPKLNIAMNVFYCAPVLTDDDRIKFKDELKRVINRVYNERIEKLKIKWDYENPRFGSAFWVLSVDYHPCPILAEAAENLNIDITNGTFPCKSCMWIRPGMVEVSAGYRSDVVTLYSERGQNND